jgi:hypothetical protein
MAHSPAEVAAGIFDAIGHKSRRMADGSYLVHCVVHHPDEHPSLHVTATQDTVLVHCQTGCDPEQVIGALRDRGLWFDSNDHREVPPSQLRRVAGGAPVRIYKYRNENGTVVGEKGRFESPNGKWFKWRKPGVVNWPAESGLKIADLSLYGRDKIGSQGTVYFCEGEKAAEACREAGLVAVTLAGGAGQKDFGKALDCLKRRDVILWPDNDAPGRSLMRLVEAHLRTLDAQVSYVRLPETLPEKGDAADYFAAGGTVEALGTEDPETPVVTITSESSVRVIMPTPESVVTLDFEEIEKTGRELNCRLTINFFATGGRPIVQRQNLDSNSQRTELRRELDGDYGKTYGWSRVLRDSFWLARSTYLSQDRGIDVGDIPDSIGDLELIPPFMPMEGATVLFAGGASCKSYISSYLALYSAMNWAPCPPFTVSPGRVLYVDYESGPSTFRLRCRRLAQAVGIDDLHGLSYWDPHGLPLKDCWEPIREKVQRDGVRWVVIDSAGPACNGEAEKADAALQFFGALRRIGLPALIIAHITKSGEHNKDTPFGSVMWNNAARRTWYVANTEHRPDSDVLKARMICKKVNDGPRPKDIGLQVRFEGRTGPVHVESIDPDQEPELVEQTSARHQIWTVLDQPMTIAEIVELTGLKTETVRRALHRGGFVNQVGRGNEGIYARMASVVEDHEVEF